MEETSHLMSDMLFFFLTGAILHFPLKRAVTSVLAIGEVYILQSCCGTIPRPRHAHMNTHVEGGKEQLQWASTRHSGDMRQPHLTAAALSP